MDAEVLDAVRVTSIDGDSEPYATVVALPVSFTGDGVGMADMGLHGGAVPIYNPSAPPIAPTPLMAAPYPCPSSPVVLPPPPLETPAFAVRQTTADLHANSPIQPFPAPSINISMIAYTLTQATEFWAVPTLYRDTATVAEIFQFLVEKRLCDARESIGLEICKNLVKHDVLHMYGSLNIDEADALTMSTVLKVGRRFLISEEEKRELEEEAQVALLLKLTARDQHPGDGGNSEESSGAGSPDKTRRTASALTGTSASLLDRLSRASRRIFVGNPTHKDVADVIRSAIQASIFSTQYPAVPIDRLEIHDMFAIDRTMRVREKPLEEGVIAYKNKVMNKEIYDPGLRSNYAPSVFRALRTLFRISEDFYANSLLDQALEVISFGGAGASGALFLRSKDKHFIVKSVTKAEVRTMRSILPHYVEHCQAYPNTLLPHIYGLFKVQIGVRPQDITRVMICNNIFDSLLSVDVSFDLKGSTANRFVSPQERMAYQEKHGKGKFPTLKDLNFKGSISLPPEMRDELFKQIERDTMFLRKMKIMDYSLLLGVHQGELAGDVVPDPEPHNSKFQQCYGGLAAEPLKAVYFCGIIDILQQYTAGKKVERFVKTKLLRGISSSDGIVIGKHRHANMQVESHPCIKCKQKNEIFVPINDSEHHVFEFICRVCQFQQDVQSVAKKAGNVNISAIDPTPYQERFMAFMSKTVMPAGAIELEHALGFKPYEAHIRRHSSKELQLQQQRIQQQQQVRMVPPQVGNPHQHVQAHAPKIRMLVTIPQGVAPGGHFVVASPDGRRHSVMCPTNCYPGMKVQIIV
jgi:hypothetical protein